MNVLWILLACFAAIAAVATGVWFAASRYGCEAGRRSNRWQHVAEMATAYSHEVEPVHHDTSTTVFDLSALPHDISVFPVHTLSASQRSLPGQFYYTACELVPVQDQGSCNACTAFSSFAMLANRLSLQTGDPPRMLSVQQFLDCTEHPCAKPMTLAQPLGYAQTSGLVQASAYPYERRTASVCRDKLSISPRVFASRSESVSPSEKFEVGDARHLDTIRRAMEEIFQFGPIVSVIQVFSDLLNSYRATSRRKGSDQVVNVIYEPRASAQVIGYHAIMVIGWIRPTEGSFEGACWCCLSSWGSDWPPSPVDHFPGLFFIQMGTNECGIEEQMVAAYPLRT